MALPILVVVVAVMRFQLLAALAALALLLSSINSLLDMAMTNALASFVTVVGASRSRSQEWLSCTRVLWDWLYNARPYRASQRDDGMARSERRSLQVNGLLGYLEQPVRVGGCVGLHMA